MAFPSHFLAFTASLSMMDAFMSLHYFRALLMLAPFTFLMTVGTFLGQQSSLLVSKIELLDSENYIANEIRVENLKGEVEIIEISKIKKVLPNQVKTSRQTAQLKYAYPVFIGDLMMILDMQGVFSNPEIFKAVVNGYDIDLENVMEDDSDENKLPPPKNGP